MNIVFPSSEFDDAVAALCHGVASDEQVAALNQLLRDHSGARDEYILRLELHSRLASTPDLFVSATAKPTEFPAELRRALSLSHGHRPTRAWRWALVIAAGLTLLIAAGWWTWRFTLSTTNLAATSQAVAMLNQTVDAQWSTTGESPRLGGPLDPGWLKLERGLAQIVFYSGARLVIEGPAEVQLISPNHAACRTGKVAAEIPSEARGFQLDTPQGMVTDLGTSFGVEVWEHGTELHVFKGHVLLQEAVHSTTRSLAEGAGVVMEHARAPRLVTANRSAFASLFNLREKSLAVEALRLERWRVASNRLNRDASLRVRFDFEHAGPALWQLQNVAQDAGVLDEATIVGCQFTKGRWPEKRALEFQSVSDRVRMNVPGEFESVTLATWVRVQGLDRKLNSLFMCDGFGAGTIHWLIRNDGVLGLTIVGPQAGNYQIIVSPPVVTLEKLGMWLHLAVVIDGRTGHAVHYVNGRPVARLGLQFAPPYRIGMAELGNWNGKGFPENDPFMIRNFSGAMDDFCLFGRALDEREIERLYQEGKPDFGAVALHESATRFGESN